MTAVAERNQEVILWIVLFANHVMNSQRLLRFHAELTDPLAESDRVTTLTVEILPITSDQIGAAARTARRFLGEGIERFSTIRADLWRQIRLAARVVIPKSAVDTLNRLNEGVEIETVIATEGTDGTAVFFEPGN